MTKCSGVMRVVSGVTVVAAVMISAAPHRALAQELADYDYDNLSFRGIGLEVGYLYADNIEDTGTLGVRFDLGYLGPGFRLMPAVTYWESTMAQVEVDQFEDRLEELTVAQGGTPPPSGFDLGVIERSDVVVSLDGHYVWAVPLNLFFFAGVGLSAHFLNGGGSGIEDTFVEDLLDSVAAGFSVQAGLELPITDRVRITGGSKFEILGDLNYLEFRGGLSFIWGGLVAGEGQ